MLSLKAFAISILALSAATSSASNQHAFKQYNAQPIDNSTLQATIQDATQLLALHKVLVKTPSISYHEHEIAIFLKGYLETLNLEVELQPVPSPSTSKENPTSKPRLNVFAHPPGQRQTPLLLTSHIDTVPPFIPYTLHADSTIWGRGTVDAKGSVASQIFAYLRLLHSDRISASDVSLLYVVGEEVDGSGMHAANTLGVDWDAVIFGEPTEGKLVSGHKGLLICKIRAKGKGGHSGYPEMGESAVSMLLPALLALEKAEMPWSEKYGNTTVNIGLLRGGVAANVIPAEAEAGIGVRIAAGEPEVVRERIEEVVRGVDERLEVEFVGPAYGPVDIDVDVEGFETMTVNYGTDVPNLQRGRKRYLYGPGSILVAHGPDEHLSVENLEDAVEGYQRLILGVLGVLGVLGQLKALHENADEL